MIIEPSTLSQRERYSIATGSVVPRPIAWVSTMDEAGRLNLAPFSFFTIACTNPLTLLFCPQVVAVGTKKDTLHNIERVHEFVINIVSEETLHPMNLSATPLPAGDSEFEWAGVTPAASARVRVPRVAEAPISFECSLAQLLPLSERVGGGTVVIGEVRCIHIRDDIYRDGYIALDALRPIARIGGDNYAPIRETIALAQRPAP